MTKIKIISVPTKHSCWYEDSIGEEYVVIRETPEIWWVVDNEGFSNIVYKENAELIIDIIP